MPKTFSLGFCLQFVVWVRVVKSVGESDVLSGVFRSTDHPDANDDHQQYHAENRHAYCRDGQINSSKSATDYISKEF